MKSAIRYYSKFGHTEQMVKAIEPILGTKASTVATPLNEQVDVLFLGAGVFLGKVNKEVEKFIAQIQPNQVGCVVLFGSCAIIDSPVLQMSKALKERGVKVHEQSFTCKGSMGPIHSGHPDKRDIQDFCDFAKTLISDLG